MTTTKMNNEILIEETETNLFRSSVISLIDFVREHPTSGAAKHIKQALISLAFNRDVAINLLSMSTSVDDVRRQQLSDAIFLRPWKTWPSDYISDDEIQSWIE